MTNCVNCGQQISMGVTICPYCGATQQGYVQPQQGYGQPMMDWWTGTSPDMQGQPGAKKSINGKKIGIIAGVVVALALVIVLVIKFIGPGAPTQKAAIKSYVEAVIAQNADDYFDACFPKKLLKGVIKEYDISNDDFKYETEQMLSDYADADEVRKIKIIDKEKMDRSDIEDFEDEIKDEFNVNIKISELVLVEYEYEAKEDGEWENESDTITLYKTDGKWFVKEDLIMYGIKYNGTYELSEVSAYGISFSSEEFEEISGQKLDMKLTIKGSKCTISSDMAGLGIVGSGSVKINFSGENVTIESSSQTITGKYDSKEKTITITYQGVDMVFSKK